MTDVLEGVMLLWFIMVALSVAFVAIDIRSTPEAIVLKWGFVLVTLFIGPIAAFLYVIGCREPMAGMHERYVAAQWRQTLGSTMHCVAGDGVGILAGAVIGSLLMMPRPADVIVEYLLGFSFGWGIFQALFMRDMVGGSYLLALRSTFMPELLSMNCLMGGMIPVSAIGRSAVAGSVSPAAPAFWFIMSMALLTGFIIAYPMNWWLVARGLKHGMLTVRRPVADRMGASDDSMKMDMKPGAPPTVGHQEEHRGAKVAPASIVATTVLSFVVMAAGIGIAIAAGAL